MKKFYQLFFIILNFSIVFVQAQTVTVTFKPDSIVGNDAIISISDVSCTPSAGVNYGNAMEFQATAWTFTSQSCPWRTARSLLKFIELSTIPSNATILSAELKLFGVPSSSSILVGNSSYPGSPYNNSSLPPGSSYNTTNESVIQKITSTWDEQTVTWNTQPTTTTLNQIQIPNTTSQWNWNFTINTTQFPQLTDWVQDWVNNPDNNFGFMVKLENENYYRSVLFASSDHTNPALWPELTVTYEKCSIDTVVIIDTVYVQKPCPCEANFSYIVNTIEPNNYYFMASNPSEKYEWMINGRLVSNASSFNYFLRPGGNYEICYYKIVDDSFNTSCRKCINICTTTNDTLIFNNDYKEVEITKTEIKQESFFSEDQIFANSTEGSKIIVYPNPTANGWTVKITVEKEEIVKVQLADMNGKIVYSDKKNLMYGENSFIISTNNLGTGNYSLQVIGKTINSSKILLKK